MSVTALDLPYAPPDVAAVRTCIDGHCRIVPRERAGIFFDQRDVGGQRIPIPVSATLLDVRGRPLVYDTRVVRRKRHAPNGERCGPICFQGSVKLGPDGRLRTQTGFHGLRLPSSRDGQPRADVIAHGRVRRIGATLPTPRPLPIAADEPIEIRTDARSYVRLFTPGHLPPTEYQPFELSEDLAGRIWSEPVPDRARTLGYVMVRLDRRTDHQVVELRLPITTRG